MLEALLFSGLLAGGLRAPWAWTWASVPLCAVPLWKEPPAKTPAAGLWAAWLAWTALCALLSREPLIGFASFSKTACALVFYLAACGAWTAASRRRWFRLLLGSGAVLALAALCVRLPGRPMVGLLFPYSNYTACVQAAAFAAGLGALASGYPRGRAPRGLLLALMALALAAVLLARSRGALLACAVALVLALARRARGRAPLLALVSLAALASLLPLRILAPLLKLDQPGAQTRPQLWAAALAVAADHPILGEGPGQFERGFLRHNFPAPAGHRPTRYGLYSAHAHSEPLQTAAETGWPGLALFLAALAASLCKRAARPGDWTREAGLLAFCAVFVQALFDNLLFLPGLSLLYFSALAVATGDGRTRPRSLPAPLRRALWSGALALCALAWLPAWTVADARRRAREGGAREAESWVLRALRLSPADAGLWEELARARLKAAPPDERGALAALARAEELHPTGASAVLMAAELARGRGLWAQTLALSDKVLALEPVCPQATLLRAEALWRLGRREEARRAFAAPAPEPDIVLTGYDALILHRDEARRREVAALLAR